METLTYFIDLFVHLDKHLGTVIETYGTWTYGILALILFCETGLVVTPFLPGDSLLFAAGAFAGRGYLELSILLALLTTMAILGDAVNYTVGKYFGAKAFSNPNSRIFRREYLEYTEKFYEKYGAKTIVIARFVPIVRTFAPFLAGIGHMSYAKFAVYNVSGAVLWVFLLTCAGAWFSELPIVKNNFTLVIFAIIILSILPAVFEILRVRRGQRSAKGRA